MKNSIETKPSTSATVKAVCVAVENMGVMDTPFGKKPMVKFTFEIDELNEYGSKRRLTRIFNRNVHPMSAVSEAVKTWCGRDLAAEENYLGGVDWSAFVDSEARLRTAPGNVKDGRHFENIVEILPPADDDAKASNETKGNN